jgi:hypothetical protein
VSLRVLKLENPVPTSLRHLCGLNLDLAQINSRTVSDVHDGSLRNVLPELRNCHFTGLAAVRVFIQRVREYTLVALCAALRNQELT